MHISRCIYVDYVDAGCITIVCYEQYRFVAMPSAQQSVGISSSVAVFLLIISICCVLSMSSRELFHNKHGNKSTNNSTNNSIVFPSYVPNIALICVMLTGITAIVIFIRKKEQLTNRSNGCKSTRRHDLHRKYSFYSIAVFFIGVCTLNMNYLLVVVLCQHTWYECWPNNKEYFIANIVLMIFRIVAMVFAIFEIVVCWMMKHRNFTLSHWVWQLVAVLQAANIAMWFHSLVKESYDRIEEQEHPLEAYFSFCYYTPLKKNSSDHLICSESLSVVSWFILSAPVLLPITIEFNLLVTETLLDRSIGAKSHSLIEYAGEGDNNQELNIVEADAHEPTDRTPLLGERPNRETTSICSKMFTSISVIINTVQLLLCVVVFFGCKKRDLQSQLFNDIYTAYTAMYYLILIAICIVGMVICRKFKRQQHSHISFLEYLLLCATSGVLFQSVKRIAAFIANNNRSFVRLHLLPVYYMTDLLDLVQVSLQIVFYYDVKDVKMQYNDGTNVNQYWVNIFRTVVFVISTCNFVQWIINSFLYPNMRGCITPTEDFVIESWPMFDSVMIPIYIFFRFNSALLFWCIYKNFSRRCERRHDGDVAIERPQQTVGARRYGGNTPVPLHGPSWPVNRLRGRAGRRRTRSRPREESTLL